MFPIDGSRYRDTITAEVVNVGKYLLTGGYTTEAWKAMIENPSDRTAAARKLIESIGGKLESFYWSFGEHDFVAIFDGPDDVSAAAGSVVAAASGALHNVKTTKLITQDESRKLLEKAKTAAAAYTPPTKVAAGVR